MPQVNMAIGNTHETITRPVVFGVVQDCLKQLGFDERAHFTILGYSNVHINKNNVFDKVSKNYFGTDTTAEIEIIETPRQEQLLTMNLFRPDELCVFRDEKSNFYIRPVKQMTNVTLNFSLRFNNKGDAMKWRDDITSRASILRHDNFHRVVYSYPIPEPFMQFLYDCHTIIAEEDSSEPSDFADWFFKHADTRTTTLTNVGVTEHTVVVPETQVRVLGYYDFSGIPEKPSFDKDSSTWKVEWSYNFIYDKVIECVLFYELLVRQRLIPDKYIPEEKQYDLYMESNLAMGNRLAIADEVLPGFDNIGGIFINRVPQVDTWYPYKETDKGALRDYTPVFIGLVSLNEDKRSIINLKQLGDFEFHENTIDFFELDRQFLTNPNKSIINVTVFGDDTMALPQDLIIDEDLNVSATFDLPKSPMFRVVVSVIKNLQDLSDEAGQRYRDNACITKGVLDIIYKNAADDLLIPRPDGRCKWSRDQWEYIVDLTNPKQTPDWNWGWPPRVPGVDGPRLPPKLPIGPDGQYGPGKEKPSPIPYFSVMRTQSRFLIIGRRES